MYEVKPHGEKWILLKNGVTRGVFNSPEIANDNKEFFEKRDKENARKS